MLIFFISINFLGYSQGIINGEETSSHILPVRTNKQYSYSQQIYLKEEIANIANNNHKIRAIRFKIESFGNNWTNANKSKDWKIYLANTEKSTFENNTDWISTENMQEVFSGIVNFPLTGGEWMQITLLEDFMWDTSKNIIIAIKENSDGSSKQCNFSCYKTGAEKRCLSYTSTTNFDENNAPSSNIGNNTENMVNQIDFLFSTENGNISIENQIGSEATSIKDLPIKASSKYSYSQLLYLKAEMQGIKHKNFITKILFKLHETAGSTSNSKRWKVSLANTLKNSFENKTDWIAPNDMTVVFDGELDFPQAGEWLEIPLSTPFVWDASKNIAVAIKEYSPEKDTDISWAAFNSEQKRGLIYFRNTEINEVEEIGGEETKVASKDFNKIPQIKFVGKMPLSPCETPTIETPTVCANSTIADLPQGNGSYKWYANAQSTEPLDSSTVLTQTSYFATQFSENCLESAKVEVSINLVPLPEKPTGEAHQSFENIENPTVGDIVTNEENVIWYISEADAHNDNNPLNYNTPLINETTYYGVVKKNNCTSPALAVTVTTSLNTKKMELNSLKYYPNPIKDILNIENESDILLIKIYDMNGKLIKTQIENSKRISVDTSQLSQGVYFVKLITETTEFSIKVIKE